MLQTFQGTIQENGRITIQGVSSLPKGQYTFVAFAPPDPTKLLNRVAAQRKAQRWVITQVSMLATIDDGQLIMLNNRLVWNFGLLLASRTHSGKGPFGFVAIDALTGKVLATEEDAAQLITDGTIFARSLSSAAR